MSGQRAIAATIDTSPVGYWRVVAKASNGASLDVTIFRGMPTLVGDFSFADPFGPVSMSISFPQVTIFDALGTGDLAWSLRHVNVDVIWVGDLPANYPFGSYQNGSWVPAWHWEGYITSFSFSKDGMSIQLKGAMLQLDNFLAKPEYLSRPLPYEWAIYRQFLDKPSLRMAPLRVIWPSWWTKTYTPPPPGTPGYLVPSEVRAGMKWTGLLTRDSGSWDPVLTSYIQTMLTSMYTERGRWSLELGAGRIPQLIHRDFVYVPDATTVVIDPVSPGTVIDLTEDWEASLTTVYGQGTSLSGVTYSGMVVTGDGAETSYAPLAAARQVWPASSSNPWHDPSVMAKEVLVQMQTGLEADEAAVVARAHLARFADPGMTGTIVLGSDPTMGGVALPRHLVRAGMNVHIPLLFGRPEGVLANVSASSHSITNGNTTLTIDTKRRDALTVEEVRTRGRDAMSINRMLIGGQYAPAVGDQLFPWSYPDGSGYVPKAATALFAGMPKESVFPWTSWTIAHPPSNPTWAPCYLRGGVVSGIANGNWITTHTGQGTPIRMSAAGKVKLLQIAAYNRDGTPAKVPFHVSFYTGDGVNITSMPAIPAEQSLMHRTPGGGFYQPGEHYPFARDGWESIKADGSQNDPNVPTPVQTVGLVRAYGTYYEKAGYFPGHYSAGEQVTGQLVDETESWTYDLTEIADASFNRYKPIGNLNNLKAAILYLMIYCDGRSPGQSEVFFMGRLFRSEPTTKGT